MKITLLYILFAPIFVVAQLPWNTKLVLTNPSGLTDTVWVGCDVNGDIGYQEGYDSLSTNFFPPVAFLAYDEEVENEFGFGTCVNLKKDIRRFVDTGTIEFTFYALTDVYPSGLDTFSISWDTTDFKYNDSGNRITYATISSEFGYIYGIDADYIVIEYIDVDYPDTLYGFLKPTIAALYPFDSLNSCSNGAWAIKLRLTVAFNVFNTPILDRPIFMEISLHPNPLHNYAYIKNKQEFNILVELYNLSADKVFSINAVSHQTTKVDLSNLPNGLYVVKYILNDNLSIAIQKIIKN